MNINIMNDSINKLDYVFDDDEKIKIKIKVNDENNTNELLIYLLDKFILKMLIQLESVNKISDKIIKQIDKERINEEIIFSFIERLQNKIENNA